MAPALILDTTFLIDLEREQRRAEGPAHRFLDRHPEGHLAITPTVLGEMAAGLDDDGQDRLEILLASFRIVPIDREVCWRYSRIYRHLKDNGMLIGSNDLWIAATALVHRMPLVTADERHYRRVPGLTVLSHRP